MLRGCRKGGEIVYRTWCAEENRHLAYIGEVWERQAARPKIACGAKDSIVSSLHTFDPGRELSGA